MRSNGNVIRDHGIHWPTQQWETVRDWYKTHVTREHILVAALAAGAFGSAGYVLLVLHRALQNYTVTGF